MQGPDPGWIEILFYRLRTLEVDNAFNLAAVALPAVLVGFGGHTKLAVQVGSFSGWCDARPRSA